MIAVDTNLLVYAHRSGLPERAAALRALERACNDPRGRGVPLPRLVESWSVVTHPSSSGRPSRCAEARAFANNLIEEAGGVLWVAGAGFGKRLFELAEDLGVAGPRIFDLQIALIASDNGATEVRTHDRGFLEVPGLRVVDPLGP